MSSWLSMFVVEIRRQDGKPYPSSTLKHILVLCKVLDSKLKELRPEGVGPQTKQADPITEEEET